MGDIKFIMAVAVITALAVLTGVTQAQSNERPYRMSDKQLEKILHGVEKDAKTFRSSLDHALDQSRLDLTGREDDVNAPSGTLKRRPSNCMTASTIASPRVATCRTCLIARRALTSSCAGTRLTGGLKAIGPGCEAIWDRLASAYGVRWRWQQAYLRVETQPRPYRVNDREVERLLRRSEKAAQTFRCSLDRSLDHSRLDGTSREDDINQFVKEFEDATKQLRDRFDGRTSVAADVESVLTRAARIDDFMRRHQLDRRTQRDWTKLRNELDQLARTYNVAWNWHNRTY